MLCELLLHRRDRGCIALMSCLHVQALDVLRRIRGTQNVQLEYDDIMAASKVAAQVATLPISPHMSSSAFLQHWSCRKLELGCQSKGGVHVAAGEEPLEDNFLEKICARADDRPFDPNLPAAYRSLIHPLIRGSISMPAPISEN